MPMSRRDKRWWTHECKRAGKTLTWNVYYNCPYCGHCKTSWLSSQQPILLRRKLLREKLIEIAQRLKQGR